MRHAVFGTLVALVTSFAFEGCGRVNGNDSESHFLRRCFTTCGAGLTCRCGLCTKSCADDLECSGIAEHAQCVETRTDDSCTASLERTCDVPCDSSTACVALGTGFECREGACRVAPPAVGEGSVFAGPTCSTVGYPDPPVGAAPGVAEDLVFAEYSLELGEITSATDVDRYRNLGLNLDRLCTNDLEPTMGCQLPFESYMTLDGPGGIDNNLGFALSNLKATGGQFFSSMDMSVALQEGGAGALVRIRDYNATADDASVVVSVAIRAPLSLDGGAPKWNGEDVWPVESSSLVSSNLDAPRYVDSGAYVTGGTLVARFDDLSFPLDLVDVRSGSPSTAHLELPLRPAILRCHILFGIWPDIALECTLGARVLADDMVGRIWQFPDPTNPSIPLCPSDSPTGPYEAYRTELCLPRDLPSGSADSVCDSLSFGMTFRALPARIGSVITSTPAVDPCPPQDPKTETCNWL